jgi:hypothetical protein
MDTGGGLLCTWCKVGFIKMREISRLADKLSASVDRLLCIGRLFVSQSVSHLVSHLASQSLSHSGS